MNKTMKTAFCVLCCLCLCGCRSDVPTPTNTATTLPPAQTAYAAPVGDAGMNYTATMPLYLPSTDRQRLLAQYAPLTLSHSRNNAETVVRALLDYEGGGLVTDLGQGVHLQLSGQEPVQVSGGVCTVNLAASALQLDHETLYTACLGIAATLCEMDGIHYVNVLVADQAVGLDITSNLPMGSLTAHPGESLPALWEAAEARKAPLGTEPATVPLTGVATLYFPLVDGSGILPETRNLSFAGQSPQQLASTLLTALSAGAQYQSGIAEMPDLNELLVYAPEVSDLSNTGGRMVTLTFTGELSQCLTDAGIDPACFISAVVMTLTTYIPSVTVVQTIVGETRLTSLYNRQHGMTTFADGLQRRNDFTGYLMQQVTLQFVSGSSLCRVSRAVSSLEAASPRVLLRLLLEGPNQAELNAGLEPPLPTGLSDADILGISMEGDTLLLNLSANFADAIRAMSPEHEQTLCYSMVNTLCEAKGLKRARFFFGGEVVETLAGTVYWGGEFLVSPGLVDGTRG